MMNAAMDRWGVASSSIYNNYNRRSLNNKENDSRNSNVNDDSKKNRKPLSQKQQQPDTEQPLNSKPKLSVLTSQKSYDDQSSGSEGSDLSDGNFERKSNAAAEILDTIEDTINDGTLLIDTELDAPPPIDNVVRTPMAEEEMNDVSTIAGDTFAGIMMDADVAEAVPPYPTLDDMSLDMSPPIKSPPGKNVSYDAMITPTFSVINHKKKSFPRTFDDYEDYDDESTKPESPDKVDDEELVRVEEGQQSRNRSFKKKKAKDSKRFSTDDDGDDQSALPGFEGENQLKAKQNRPDRERCRFRSMMCCGCLLATFLMVAIGVLGYTLYALRNQDNGALSLFNKEFWKSLGREDNEAIDDSSDDATDKSSVTVAPNNQHIDTVTGTIPPSDYDYETAPKMEEIRSMVLSASIEKAIPGINGTALNDPGSVQFSVLEWLAQDPKYDSYSKERIIQRYALGCFYKSILGEDSGGTNADADEVRSTWMVEDDECTSWLNTNTNSNKTCRDNGMIRSIHLEGVELTGTLASEIALVSDSLESIFLTKNKIQGTIPSAYGKLTNLKRLQLSRNSLEGTLNGPDLLSPLAKLEIIGLGGNKLTGTLPKELGSMPSMYYLNFPYNKFTGTIPSEWNSTKLKHLSIAMNELTGTIPSELTRIESLNNLFLFGNNLYGSIPESVCRGAFANNTYNGMNVTIDCESVSCSCCGCNGVTPPPTQATLVPAIGGGFFEGLINNTNDTAASNIDSSSVLVTDSSFSEALYNISKSGSTTDGDETVADTEGYVPSDSSSTSSPSTGTSALTSVGDGTLAPGSFPYIDDAFFAEAVYALNGDATNRDGYGCQSISIGSSCYSSGWSIDFELTNRNCRSGPPSNPPPATEDYDIVGLYIFKGDVQRPPSNTGTQVPLSEAVFWATSCGLADCNGVLANGQVYYRNNNPKQTSPLWIEWWPVNPGSMMQLLWLRADNSGTAVVIAESRPFLISNRCR